MSKIYRSKNITYSKSFFSWTVWYTSIYYRNWPTR